MPKPLPSQERLKELFDYDPETGILTWRVRVGTGRQVGAHNKRFAGKAAGSTMQRGKAQYLTVEIEGKPRYAHRVIFKLVAGEEPLQVDHINCDGLDNRFANLRAADNRQNQGNRRVMPGKKGSAYKGVERTVEGRYRAHLTKGRRTVHLGVFDTAEQASAAYVEAARQYFGDFARQ